MPSDNFITPEMLSGALPATMLIGAMFASLFACFFGYVLFRIELAISSLAAGIGIGAGLVTWRCAMPSGVDYLVICSAAGLLMLLMGWFLYRLAFGLLVLVASIGAALLLALMYTSATPSSVGPYLLGSLVGLPLGLLAYVYMKPVFVFLSAMGGAILAIYNGAIVIIGPRGILDPTWSTKTTMIAALLLAVAIAIGIAGMRTQGYLSRVLRSAFMPKDGSSRPSARRKRKKNAPGKATAHPRFSRG